LVVQNLCAHIGVSVKETTAETKIVTLRLRQIPGTTAHHVLHEQQGISTAINET